MSESTTNKGDGWETEMGRKKKRESDLPPSEERHIAEETDIHMARSCIATWKSATAPQGADAVTRSQ
jgi:hypothetical protein